MKLAKRERLILYVCIFLILITILDRFVFKPLADRLFKLHQEIQVMEAKLIKGLRAERQRDVILKEYKNYETYLKIKGSDEEIVSELLREIEKLARESNVSLSDIKPRSTNKRAMFKEYTIEVRTDASLKDVVNFLYRLNSSILLLQVDKLVLNLAEEQGDILKVNMVISGIVVL